MSTKTYDDRQYDIRVIRRRIAKGEIDARDYEAWLAALPDDEKNADWVEVYEEPSAEELTPHVDELTFTSA